MPSMFDLALQRMHPFTVPDLAFQCLRWNGTGGRRWPRNGLELRDKGITTHILANQSQINHSTMDCYQC